MRSPRSNGCILSWCCWTSTSEADSGFDVARRLTAVEGGPTVILISSHEYSDFGSEITACGATGFVAKDELSVATVQRAMS